MLKYWLWLATRKGLGARGAVLAARHFSSPEMCYFAQPEEYREIPGLRNPEALTDKSLDLPEQILRACYEKQISILTMQDAAYPERLRSIDDPPLVLYVRGTMPDLNGLVVGVVGTRQASAYGMLQARKMGYGLSRGGAVVISGFAKGVDTEAMLGALTGGTQPVVGVVAGGVDVVYPPENRQLYADVAHRGCILSEYPPGSVPYRSNFPLRNRIISGLSAGVVVVEAPEKSGALITASIALDQGRDVFTIPANVDAKTCRGNLALLRDGAILARNAADVLQEYVGRYSGISPETDMGTWPQTPVSEETDPVPKAPEPKKAVDKPGNRHYIDLKEQWEALSEDERALARLLQKGPQHMDDLTEGTKLSTARILASLTLMEVKGYVRRPSAKWYELAETEEL